MQRFLWELVVLFGVSLFGGGGGGGLLCVCFCYVYLTNERKTGGGGGDFFFDLSAHPHTPSKPSTYFVIPCRFARNFDTVNGCPYLQFVFLFFLFSVLFFSLFSFPFCFAERRGWGVG